MCCITNYYISETVLKACLFCRLCVFCITGLALPDMPQAGYLKQVPRFLDKMIKKLSCTELQVVMSVSTQFTLLHVVLFCCCLLCSSFTAACHNSFYFPFVVDKHDIEPSHRCMCTQKAQLSAIPSVSRLSTSRSGGGGVSTGHS